MFSAANWQHFVMEKQIGQTVRVLINEPQRWSQPFYNGFNQQKGIIERTINCFTFNGAKRTVHQCHQVRFLSPIKVVASPSWPNEYDRFWFDENDLNGGG